MSVVCPVELLSTTRGRGPGSEHRVGVGVSWRGAGRLTCPPSATVTVVIPVWDPYLSVVSEAVSSVLEQGVSGLDVVVIDNASSGASPASRGRGPTRFGPLESLFVSRRLSIYSIHRSSLE